MWSERWDPPLIRWWGDGAETARGKAERNLGKPALPFHQNAADCNTYHPQPGRGGKSPSIFQMDLDHRSHHLQCPKGKQLVVDTDDRAGERRYLDVLQMFWDLAPATTVRVGVISKHCGGTTLASSGLQCLPPKSASPNVQLDYSFHHPQTFLLVENKRRSWLGRLFPFREVPFWINVPGIRFILETCLFFCVCVKCELLGQGQKSLDPKVDH